MAERGIGMKFNRRQWLHNTALGAGGMALSGCMGTQRQPGGKQPNIVMIISDDQAWDDYSFMGHEAVQTPNIDRLSRQGVTFTRGYAASPLCCPSLASLLTGLHPHQHRITSNDPPNDSKGPRYSPKDWSDERKQAREQMISNVDWVPSLPRILGEQGYLSMQTGKWWLGHYSRGGFTHGMTHGDIMNGGRHGDEGLKIGREGMKPIHDFIAESQAKNNPFFLWYAPFLPHTPHNPPERLLKKYRDKADSIHIARYWAMCEWFDETCGQLLDHLDEKGIAEDTIVLYACDNGWIQKPHERGYAPRSKRTPYEGGIRTPIMVRWPGHVQPRFDEDTLISTVDLAPTILHACGLQPDAQMQGINLLNTSALRQRDTVLGAAYTHDAVVVDQPLTSLQYTYALEDHWKLIQPTGRNDTGTNPELYNVKADPYETRDLAQVNPAMVRHLQERIHNWWPEAVAV